MAKEGRRLERMTRKEAAKAVDDLLGYSLEGGSDFRQRLASLLEEHGNLLPPCSTRALPGSSLAPKVWNPLSPSS